MCARFQSDPKECHLVAVKRILRYLVATPCFGLWYPKGSTFDLVGYSDSDYAGCKVDRKSTSGTRGENGSGIPVGYRIRIVQITVFPDTDSGIFIFGTDTGTTRIL